jgi:hypothetical protein
VKPFDQFWAAYPRRVGKQDAQKAWAKVKPDSPCWWRLILKAIENQKQGADWRKDDGQFIPHPATWLRAGRWLDEVRPYVAPPPKLPAGWWETKRRHDQRPASFWRHRLTPRAGEMPEGLQRGASMRPHRARTDPPQGNTPLVEPVAQDRAPVYPADRPPEGVQLTA